MIVFHHIPKTGGSTVRLSFRKLWGTDAIGVETPNRLMVTSNSYDWPYQPDWTDARHLTVLRDPITRLLSYVKFMRRPEIDGVLSEAARTMPVYKFLTMDHETIHQNVPNRMVHQLGGDVFHHSISVEEAYDRALERVETFDWVLWTETLNDDLEALFGDLGEIPPRIGTKNKSYGHADAHPIMWDLTEWDRKLYQASRRLRQSPTGRLRHAT